MPIRVVETLAHNDLAMELAQAVAPFGQFGLEPVYDAAAQLSPDLLHAVHEMIMGLRRDLPGIQLGPSFAYSGPEGHASFSF